MKILFKFFILFLTAPWVSVVAQDRTFCFEELVLAKAGVEQEIKQSILPSIVKNVPKDNVVLKRSIENFLYSINESIFNSIELVLVDALKHLPADELNCLESAIQNKDLALFDDPNVNFLAKYMLENAFKAMQAEKITKLQN